MWGACVVFFGVWASLLVGWDVCFSRLPNVLTYTGFAVAIVVAVAAGDPLAILGGVAWSALYIASGYISGGVGGGDVKLAASLGILAAMCGWRGWLAAVGGASLSTVILLLITRRHAMPHGPGMIGATALVVLWHHYAGVM